MYTYIHAYKKPLHLHTYIYIYIHTYFFFLPPSYSLETHRENTFKSELCHMSCLKDIHTQSQEYQRASKVSFSHIKVTTISLEKLHGSWTFKQENTPVLKSVNWSFVHLIEFLWATLWIKNRPWDLNHFRASRVSCQGNYFIFIPHTNSLQILELGYFSFSWCSSKIQGSLEKSLASLSIPKSPKILDMRTWRQCRLRLG